MYTNVHGLINNFNQIEAIADIEKPHVDESEIVITEYFQMALLSNSTRTGGIIIYYNNNWEVKMIFEKVSDFKQWIGAYDVKHNNYSTIIVEFYRSP